MLIEPQRSIWDDYIFLSYIHRSLCKYRNECENFVEIIAIHTTICFSFRSTIVCVCVAEKNEKKKINHASPGQDMQHFYDEQSYSHCT